MTQRLYYTDPDKRQFDASIVTVQPAGDRATIRLDQTAFYPTSGGQPFDTGTLIVHGNASTSLKVVDVYDEEHDVVHLVEGDGRGLAPGVGVAGEIDWPRRFDHMQQHTGQHLLSAAFDRLFSARTISFHLGSESCTIDLAREVTSAEIANAETEANRVVWEDRPVVVRFVTPEEAAALPLRKEPVREGALRLIDIEGFDLSACGGTHVPRTGVVGLIGVTRWERFKGGQRLEFVCGGRALARLRFWRDTMAAGTRLLSVAAADLAPAIERLQAEAKDSRRTIDALENDLTKYRSEELAAAGEPTASGLAILQTIAADAVRLRALAASLTSKPGRLAVLVTPQAPHQVVVAASPDVKRAANDILRALTDRFGGRGGGKRDLAQGGGLEGTADQILDEARQLWRAHVLERHI